MVAPENAQVGVGTHLGDRYELVREIGRGGFGAVYEARDTPLNRSVAIKLIHNSWTEAGAELEREATLLAGIRSPHVVRVLDASVMETPPYLVMELLQGASVRVRIAQGGAMSMEEAFRILDESLQGLSALHDRTLIHGDIKPENVILTSEGAKLIDLGISRPWTGAPGDPSQVLGTPSYLAPELIRGDRPDPRADLYSAGLLLYEMLAGQAAHLQRDDIREVTDEIHEGRRAPLTLLCPWLPFAVSEFVRRALQPDPAHRFANAEAMRQALVSLRHRAALELERRSDVSEKHGEPIGGRFVLRRRIGGAKAAELWEAEDLRRHTPVMVQRVHLGEARAGVQKLAGIRSPHVPQVYDLVPLEAGTFALVLEQLPGRLLAESMGQRLPVATLGTTAGQLLAGLAAAHQAGLVHGNLQPANILVAHVARDSILKLLGFELGDGPGAPPNPAYAAPERLRGEAPSFRSDVHAAGAVLFELLTGIDYASAGRPLDRGPIDARVFGKVAAAAPITETLRRALAPEPARRFDDARAFLAAIRDSIPPGP